MNYRSLIPKSLFLASTMVIALSFDALALGIAIDTEDLIKRAELIIIGEVVSKAGRKKELTVENYDGQKDTSLIIFTEYQIEITDIKKGVHESQTISVFSLGGSTEDYSDIWSISFDFSVGDITLLFLELNKLNDIWMPVGNSKGAFRLIEKDGLVKVEGVNEDMILVKGSQESGEEHRNRQRRELEKFIKKGEQ